jgi:hypothetical protein
MTRHPRSIAMLLGGLALLGPLSVDAYLPAFVLWLPTLKRPAA